MPEPVCCPFAARPGEQVLTCCAPVGAEGTHGLRNGPGRPCALPPTLASVPDRPVRMNAELDVPLSRRLWLVKWILVIPHHA